MDKNRYRECTRKMLEESNYPSGVCYICGEDDPRILKEEHHIFGKANSEEKVLLCLNCHSKITQAQNKLPPKVRSNDASERDKIVVAIVSQGSILEVIGKKQKEFGYRLLEAF